MRRLIEDAIERLVLLLDETTISSVLSNKLRVSLALPGMLASVFSVPALNQFGVEGCAVGSHDPSNGVTIDC